MKKALMIIAIVVLVIVLGGIGIFYYYTGRLQQNNAVEIVEKPVETPQQLVLGTLDPSSITPSPTPEPTPTAHPIYAVDTINENIPEIGRYGDGLKIYYNLFFDDKAGLREAYYALNKLCYYVKHGIIVKLEENI